MIIGFTGTQRGMSAKQQQALRALLRYKRATCLVHGACVGADAQAHQIAGALGIARKIFPGRELGHPKRAPCLDAEHQFSVAHDPLARNRLIVEAADLLFAAPKEEREVLRSGTWATIRAARKRDCPLVIVTPSGERL